MEKIRLDEKSRKILRILRFNSRIPLTKLSKKVGLSKETMSYRLKNMVSKGLITKFLPELNVHKMGLTIFRVALKLKNIDETLEKSFEEYLISLPTIWLGYQYGEWDLLFGMIVKNPLEFNRHMNNIAQKFSAHIYEKAIGIQINDFFLG